MQKQIRNQLNWQQFLFLICSFCFLLLACQSRSTDTNPKGDIQVRIPSYRDGHYVMDTVNLVSVEDMTHLSGWVAQFFLSPAETDSGLIGVSPLLQTMRTESGVYVATDDISLQMLTLYAHFERLYFLDQDVGVPNYTKLKWPVTIAIQSLVNYEDGRRAVDNAMYKPKSDSYFFTIFNMQTLPLNVNAGVLAHEHFHAIFHQLVIKNQQSLFDAITGDNPHSKVKTNTEKISTHSDSNRFRIRGLNEGLADVWGWIYSDDEKFVSRSLPMQAQRNLDSNFEIIFAGTESDFYNYGTAHAKVLVTYTKNMLTKTEDLATAKIRMAQAILKTLPQFSDRAIALEKDEQILNDDEFIILLDKNLPGLKDWYSDKTHRKTRP